MFLPNHVTSLPRLPQFCLGAVSGAGHPFKKHQSNASGEKAAVNSLGKIQLTDMMSDTQTGASQRLRLLISGFV